MIGYNRNVLPRSSGDCKSYIEVAQGVLPPNPVGAGGQSSHTVPPSAVLVGDRAQVPLIIRTPGYWVRPPVMILASLDCIDKDPVSKSGHILRLWVLDLPMTFWRTQFHRNKHLDGCLSPADNTVAPTIVCPHAEAAHICQEKNSKHHLKEKLSGIPSKT